MVHLLVRNVREFISTQVVGGEGARGRVEDFAHVSIIAGLVEVLAHSGWLLWLQVVRGLRGGGGSGRGRVVGEGAVASVVGVR